MSRQLNPGRFSISRDISPSGGGEFAVSIRTECDAFVTEEQLFGGGA